MQLQFPKAYSLDEVSRSDVKMRCLLMIGEFFGFGWNDVTWIGFKVFLLDFVRHL